ncbi:hypothetical protein TNCV_2051461 [Trichonephila clavipes]|nr:hypothetical protein TNCV_2051461 [Trichonephila clavipes]
MIEVDNSDSSGSKHRAKSFEEDRPRSDQPQSVNYSESGERRGAQEKSSTGDLGGRRKSNTFNKEASSRSSGGDMQDQEEPVWYRRERFQKPCPYNQKTSYREESRRQIRQESEQEPWNGRSSR